MKNKNLFHCAVMILMLSPVLLLAEESPETNRAKSPESEVLSAWIDLHLKLVRSTKALSQLHIARHFTYSSIAFYEAVVHSYPKQKSLGGQLQDLPALPSIQASKNFCWQASGNAAMSHALKAFYSNNPQGIQRIDSLEADIAARLVKEGCAQEKIQEASGYGKSVASAIIEWSKTDGSSVKYPPYEVPKGEGLWESTPPANSAPAGPYLSKNRTCVKGSTENSLPSPPSF